MRIAIVGINYAPELTGIGVYTAGLAEFLASRGISVDVYTGFPYYPMWAKAPEHRGTWSARERINGVSVRRHYLYVPGRPSAVKRMLHELSFVASASLGYLLGPRADCTIVVSPPLFLGVPILLMARLKGSQTVFHVQDLQPDAAIDFGLLKPGALTRLFFWVERVTYRLADRVASISSGMLRAITDKGVSPRKTLMIRNWANDERVAPRPRNTRYREQWGLDRKFVVLYAGNLGVKQGLPTLLECARLLRHDPEIVFLVVGDGGQKAELVAMARRLGLDSVRFEPLQPAENLGELLATADVAVAPQKAGAKDIVLPSKVANILAAARPLIAAAARHMELGRMLREADCGIVVPPENAEQMARAIVKMKCDPAAAARFGANGRAYMEARLRRDVVLERVLGELEALAGAPGVIEADVTAESHAE
jgi:colanic acid biosynthesis glycosyl transferase WcaI